MDNQQQKHYCIDCELTDHSYTELPNGEILVACSKVRSHLDELIFEKFRDCLIIQTPLNSEGYGFKIIAEDPSVREEVIPFLDGLLFLRFEPPHLPGTPH